MYTFCCSLYVRQQSCVLTYSVGWPHFTIQMAMKHASITVCLMCGIMLFMMNYVFVVAGRQDAIVSTSPPWYGSGYIYGVEGSKTHSPSAVELPINCSMITVLSADLIAQSYCGKLTYF